MSVEMRVFFRGDIPDTAALTQALHDLGFPLSVVPPHYPLATHRGFMPMLWNERQTGIEFYLDEGRDQIEEVVIPEAVADIDPAFNRTASFRYVLGADSYEFLCLICCPVALAKLVNGVVYEEQDGVVWSIDDALNETKRMVTNTLAEIAEEERK